MGKLIKSKLYLKRDFKNDTEYERCIAEMINNPVVRSMENFIQHRDISCFKHCVNVSYNSYLVCRFLGLNYQAAARGGLLHDLFLYDWHITKPENGLHGFTHPFTALENANKYFQLDEMEKDIIEKHMWPLTLKLPKYKESYIVSFVDKYCAIVETIKTDNDESIPNIEKYIYPENNMFSEP